MDLRKAIDLIISATYVEESARELNNSQDPDLVEICTYLKMANSAIERKFLKNGGVESMTEMCYNLIDIFRKISYLSIEDQNKVKEYIYGISKKS